MGVVKDGKTLWGSSSVNSDYSFSLPQKVDVCAGKTEEDYAPPANTSEMLSSEEVDIAHPDLHQTDNFTELAFFLEVRKLMETCGYYDFSWRDLHIPDPKRLRLQLSAILNLAKFREEQLKVYAELSEPVRAILLLFIRCSP